MTTNYDYIVIGGGSAGSVLATRLAQAGAEVLVLEAGISDRRWEVAIPAAVGRVYKDANWKITAEPDETRNGLKDARSVGKILGGGGSVNSCVFVRGHRADFDGWAKSGAPGWDFESVLPAFRRMETWEGGADDFRGAEGPISVVVQGVRTQANMAYLESARQAGYELNPDYNGADLSGAALTQVNQRLGFRSQSSREYLRRLAPKSRTTVHTEAVVHRILIEGGRAVGAEYRHGGETKQARAKEEVLLTAGAFGSPKLLMLSGIGPRDELSRVGIDTVVDRPGVGKNFHDHIMVFQRYLSKLPTINKRRFSDFPTGLRDFVLHGRGILTSSVIQAIAMHSTSPELEAPDTQLTFAGFALSREVLPSGMVAVGPAKEEGFTAGAMWLTPRNRGEVRLRSSSPDDPLVIQHDVLADGDDLGDLLLAMEEVRRLMEQPAMREITHGPFDKEAACRTAAHWEAYARAGAITPSHPVGTCKMGVDDMAVVDPELRVHGIDGLRVADSSIMPTVTRGNTNAPSMMIGEKAADFILGR